MPVYNLISIIVVLAAVFGYINLKYIKLPVTIGMMFISLVASLIGIGIFNYELIRKTIELIRTIDFHTALMKVMCTAVFRVGIHPELRFPVSFCKPGL